MSLSVSISLFFAVAVAYILIIDVFTIIFRMSGMTEEKAKFQVISLLTNSGYTTKESELVVSKLLRRKLARTVMLFGYIFSVTIITVFVNVVMNLPRAVQADLWTLTVILAVIFVVFMLVKRVPKVKTKFNNIIEKMGQRLMLRGNVNVISVIEQYAKGVIAGIHVQKVPSVIEGKTLGEFDMIGKYGIHLIIIKRKEEVLDYITKDTKIEADDQLVLFGRLQKIMDLFFVTQDGRASQEAVKKEEEKELE